MSHKSEKAKARASAAQPRNPSSNKKGGGPAASSGLQAGRGGRLKEAGRAVSPPPAATEDNIVCSSTSYQHQGDGFELRKSATVSHLERENAVRL